MSEHLREFAATPRQLEILETVIASGSQRKASKILKVSHQTVNKTMEMLVNRAALRGCSPDHDLTHPVAPGQKLQGASTLYRRGEVEPVLQWVKSSADAQQYAEIQKAALEVMCAGVPQVNPTGFAGITADHLCNVYTVTDAHVGALAWGLETHSGDWDLAIAERVLTGCFAEMIKASPNAGTCVIAQLGDYLHYDSAVNGPVTPMHGNILDADGRMPKMVDVAIRILLAMIGLALEKHQKVVVLIGEGNHDPAGSVWLRAMLKYMFANEPRLEVIQSELPYYVYEFGNTMLAWHHGHLTKPEQMPLLFAAQFPQIWGRTTKREVHSGHKHHLMVKEMSGMTVVQHPTLASRDAYAARGGWIAERQATSITYSKRFGRVATNIVTPEMLDQE